MRLFLLAWGWEMFSADMNAVPLPNKNEYKVGAVTYEVTAHFCSETESLKSKIDDLLRADLQKSSSICTFADSQKGDVK